MIILRLYYNNVITMISIIYKLCSVFLLFSNGISISYDESITKQAINLSQAAYCVSDAWDCETCMDNYKLNYVIDQHGERAIVGMNNKNTLFISIRGSENIMNWVDNIQVRKTTPYNDTNIEVSKGFYKAYTYLKNDIFDKLNILRSKYNTNNLLITGHSLGAAIGTLLAFDILYTNDNYNIEHLITFGSPRIGNDVFVKSFEKYNLLHYRVTHYNDIVPHVPQEFLDYLHIPSEIWYDEENTNIKICDDNYTEEDNTCSDSCGPTKCTSISDHLFYLNISLGEDGIC